MKVTKEERDLIGKAIGLCVQRAEACELQDKLREQLRKMGPELASALGLNPHNREVGFRWGNESWKAAIDFGREGSYREPPTVLFERTVEEVEVLDE